MPQTLSILVGPDDETLSQAGAPNYKVIPFFIIILFDSSTSRPPSRPPFPPLTSSQLPRRPRFIGGDRETLSLLRLLLDGTGLNDFFPPRRGGLGDREYEG